MNLPVELKTRIYTHIGKVQNHLGSFEPDQQREILQSLETHIYDALESRSGANPTLELLESIIAEIDPPESYGPPVATGEPDAEKANPPQPRQRRPLGCIVIILGLFVFFILIISSFYFSRSKDLSDSGRVVLESHLADLDLLERNELGTPLEPEYQTLFNKAITVQAFENGVVFAEPDGHVKTILFSRIKSRQKASGDIGTHYFESGGEQAFGTPFFGEITLCTDQYRAHIFSRSIMIWERDSRIIQAVHFQNGFPAGTIE